MKSQYIPPDEHPALIMCTSGTTGKPKGAMLSEKNIMTNVSDIADYLPEFEKDAQTIYRVILDMLTRCKCFLIHKESYKAKPDLPSKSNRFFERRKKDGRNP